MSGPKVLLDPKHVSVKPDLIVLSTNGQHISYRILFLCLSPYFQTVLGLSPLPAKDGFYRIDLKDVDSSVADLIMRYASCGRIHVNQDNVCDLLIVADRYNITAIINICQQYLHQNLDPSNCLETYLLAHYYNCEDLKKLVANYIRINQLLDHSFDRSNRENEEITVEMVHQILDNRDVE